ncbi:TPA: RecE family exodeoxyribonuclease [Salmonella enterica subsp. diarizonae serovar 61:r:-]
MKNITQLVFKPKKSALAKGVARPGTIWFDNDDQDEIDALSTLAIKKAGFKRSDFFKPVRVDHLVVDDMPAEGVFDTAFCDRYKPAEDGKSWLLALPAAQPESTDSDTTDTDNQEQGNEDTTNITDSGDTASAVSATSSDAGTTTAADTDSATSSAGSADTTSDTSTEDVSTETATDDIPAYEFNVNVNGEPMADVEKEMLQPVVRMDDRHRILSQFILEDKFSHNITPEQLVEVSRLELDVSDNHIQNMLLAARYATAILKLNTPDLWKYTDSFKKVFTRDKRHPLSRMINFNQAYANAHPIDRALLVKEWIEGNYISRVEKSGATNASASTAATASASDVPDPQQASVTKVVSGKPAIATKATYKIIDKRIGCALYERPFPLDPIPAKVVEYAKAVIKEDREDFKRWSAAYRITEDIQFYDEKTHIEMIRQAPRDVVMGGPALRREYIKNYLAAYGTLDPEQMVFMPKRAPVDHKENMERVSKAGKNLRDMAAGRFKCDECDERDEYEEKPQSAGTLADEPPAPEPVEPDANEHHPDTRSMATESPVTADSDSDKAPTPREQFSEQLAAERGDFVPGISDPNDPKWIHNDYRANASTSNEGEKTEVSTDSATDIADSVDSVDSADHSEEFSNQTEPEASHSEPSADQIEPVSPETELKSLQPEPVTKVADGVFDVSAFFADTSNQGEKTESASPNNDDRTTKKTSDSNQGKEPEQTLPSEPMPMPMPVPVLEVLLLLRKISRSLQHIVDISQEILNSNQQILAGQLRIEAKRRKDATAIRGVLETMYEVESREGTDNGE